MDLQWKSIDWFLYDGEHRSLMGYTHLHEVSHINSKFILQKQINPLNPFMHNTKM